MTGAPDASVPAAAEGDDATGLGRLHLIPVPIDDGDPAAALPAPVVARAASLDYFVAENARTARAFLKRLPLQRPLQSIEIRELNEHTRPDEIAWLLAPLLAGRDAGLVSEAGCPAVADPGGALVAAAHDAGVVVVPHVGPSALLLTLMASGLDGQRFAFAGYLPAKPDERADALRELEARSARCAETQLWIETPYRAQAVAETAIATLSPETRLAIGCDLTSERESIRSARIRDWRRSPPAIADRLTVFALLASGSGGARPAVGAGRPAHGAGGRPGGLRRRR